MRRPSQRTLYGVAFRATFLVSLALVIIGVFFTHSTFDCAMAYIGLMFSNAFRDEYVKRNGFGQELA